MKKTKLFSILFVTLLALTGCNKGGTTPSDDDGDPIKLEKDTATSYQIDSSVSNANGSMSYEIFVRSFYDSDGNGTGDLNGITAKLDYLQSMGIKTLWLMPIMPSPSYHGYDVTDYFAINPDYGTMADFENLVTKAGEKGIDIMIDIVFNHCSSQHKYFTDALADYRANKDAEGGPKDWFLLSDTIGDHRTQDNIYYESKFDYTMPDFNLDNEEVRAEMENILKFWIEKGVKGFRLDAVLYYYSGKNDKNIEFLNWIEDTCHKYNESIYIVGEAWTTNLSANTYFQSKCDSFFRFGNAIGGDYSFINISKGRGDASNFAEQLQKDEKAIKNRNKNGYASFFLSNHDQDRVSKNLTPEQNKVAASLYLLMPGTPFMYYGEEISMVGTRSTGPDDQSDVKRRLPMVWSKSDKTGECTFPEKNRMDLNTTKQVEDGVEDQLNEPFSLLNHYKYVINIRNKYPFLKHGVFKSMCDDLDTDETAVMAYKVSLGDEYIIIVHNFSDHNMELTAPGTEILDQINTNHLIPKLEDGKLYLGAKSSVIMK